MIRPISEEALIWAKIKQILKTKGADAAIAKLKQIRLEQQLRNAPANLIRSNS